CRDAGLLEGRLKIVDATHVVADVAIPTTVNLLREARQKLVAAIKVNHGLTRALPRFGEDAHAGAADVLRAQRQADGAPARGAHPRPGRSPRTRRPERTAKSTIAPPSFPAATDRPTPRPHVVFQSPLDTKLQLEKGHFRDLQARKAQAGTTGSAARQVDREI